MNLSTGVKSQNNRSYYSYELLLLSKFGYFPTQKTNSIRSIILPLSDSYVVVARQNRGW